MARVLVACEFSGVVREAFSTRGHDAWSCDLLPTQIPGQHVQGDVLPLLAQQWDLVMAFPPCTHLAVSGARYFTTKRADGRQQAGVEFFRRFIDSAPCWAIENPVGVMSTMYRKPDQVIQPWQYGHPESKATCLWLGNLPKLMPTDVVDKPACGYWSNQTPSGQNKLGPSEYRAMMRAMTYSGIAEAMATQWGPVLDR